MKAHRFRSAKSALMPALNTVSCDGVVVDPNDVPGVVDEMPVSWDACVTWVILAVVLCEISGTLSSTSVSSAAGSAKTAIFFLFLGEGAISVLGTAGVVSIAAAASAIESSDHSSNSSVFLWFEVFRADGLC